MRVTFMPATQFRQRRVTRRSPAAGSTAAGACRHHAHLADGNSSTPIITQEIDHTDFPLNDITLWAIAAGDHRVLMLPSEY